MNLGSKVKALRKKLRMSQRSLASNSQLTQATISRIEAGLTQQLKSHAFMRLARSLGVTVEHLAGDDATMNAVDVLKADDSITEFVELYFQLDADNRDHLKAYMRYLIQSTRQQAI